MEQLSGQTGRDRAQSLRPNLSGNPMKTFLPAAAILAAAALGATSAQAATVVTFDEHKTDAMVKFLGTTVTSGGLTFQTNDPNGMASWGSHPSNVDPTGAALLNWGSKAVITVSKAGGGLFELASFDLADNYNHGVDNLMEITFFDGARTQTETFKLDRLKGLQTIAFNRTVEWFSYRGLSSGDTGQLDNVVWNTPVVTGVPEASTWAMMIIGFAGVGGMVRRTRRTAQGVLA